MGNSIEVSRVIPAEPNRRIVQAWRTTEFPSSGPDSRLEVLLEETEGGTKVAKKR